YRPCVSSHCTGHQLNLHPFPTRRSSDLGQELEHVLVGPVVIGTGRHVLDRVDDEIEVDEPRRHVSLDAACRRPQRRRELQGRERDRKSTRLNSSHVAISYAVFCLKKKKK